MLKKLFVRSSTEYRISSSMQSLSAVTCLCCQCYAECSLIKVPRNPRLTSLKDLPYPNQLRFCSILIVTFLERQPNPVDYAATTVVVFHLKSYDFFLHEISLTRTRTLPYPFAQIDDSGVSENTNTYTALH